MSAAAGRVVGVKAGRQEEEVRKRKRERVAENGSRVEHLHSVRKVCSCSKFWLPSVNQLLLRPSHSRLSASQSDPTQPHAGLIGSSVDF